MSQQGPLSDDTTSAADIETLTGDSGGAVGPDGVHNVDLIGNPDIDIVGTPGSNSFQLTNLTKVTSYVVDINAGAAPYQTIQAALDAANAAGVRAMVLVRPGSYVENLTLYDEIDLVGAAGMAETANVQIQGTHTPPASGVVAIRNFFLAGAPDIFNSAVAGSTSLTLIDCQIRAVNGYTFNLLNWTGSFVGYNLRDASTNSGFINNTGAAPVTMQNSTLGEGTLNSMIINGTTRFFNTHVQCPIQIQGSRTVRINGGSLFDHTLTTSDSTDVRISDTVFSTGSDTAISHSSSTSMLLNAVAIESTNTNAISGTGSVELASVTYVDSSGIANTIIKDYTTEFETGSAFAQELSLDRKVATNKTTATVSTSGAVTSDIATIALGATAGVYTINAILSAFDSSTPAGASYSIIGGARTTGAAASLIGTPDKIINEEAALTTADVDIVVSGNNAIIRVTGVAGIDLNWRCTYEYAAIT
ncbi:MAG: hypothetical protein ACE5GV_00445 [Candidatus Scalindua sp.]